MKKQYSNTSNTSVTHFTKEIRCNSHNYENNFTTYGTHTQCYQQLPIKLLYVGLFMLCKKFLMIKKMVNTVLTL